MQPGLAAEQQRYVAGIDLNAGTAARMVTGCERSYAAPPAGRLEEEPEFYGNVDGVKVADGWGDIRGRVASSDSSRLWHWHPTLDRRHRADRRPMERILAIVLREPTEDDVDDATIAKTATPAKTRLLADTAIRQLLARAQQLTVNPAAPLDAAKRGPTDEQAIVDGVPTGPGTRDMDQATATLENAFGDRATELAAKLRTPAG